MGNTYHDIDSLDGHADIANALGNMIVACWCERDDKQEVVTFQYRRKPNAGRKKPVKATDIQHHNERVIHWTGKLLNGALARPSGQKSSPPSGGR